MRPHLLDVNVLIAVLDPEHGDHRVSEAWFLRTAPSGWATCPITENGFVRIVAAPTYPHPVPILEARELLAEMREAPGYRFWPCDVSVLGDGVLVPDRLHGPRQLTDAYLLALAVAHGGRFATLDRGVGAAAVQQASPEDVVLIR